MKEEFNMIFEIDTTQNIQLKLIDNNKIIKHFESSLKTEKLLELIDKFGFKKFYPKITKITVNEGPGGYTSTRIGVIAANIINTFLLKNNKIYTAIYKNP
ncbi:MAG: hypothetical protein CEN91_307 [Candidatus Berkelbacteria bacterium Licking1014_85]|uniref:Gcp-like domain-containing protein n=1 Tax=Candidatus Berkelbacteria bacterium Licking1014_85 TaxID=2017148 RepID=A0A554LJK7_9BACT|nr:MAG: hypothetical protein CEN91_307 [Candidatus Berkelbacteria bacterium Licking1014_85]